MKVLNVTALLDPVTGGGTSERTFQMSRHLAQRGHTVSVLTTSIGLTSERIAALGKVEVVALDCLSKRFQIVRPALLRIYRLVKSADVVHLMGHWGLLHAITYLCARWHGVSYAICPAGELRVFGRSRWIKHLYNRLIGYEIVRNAAAWIAVTPDETPQYEYYGIKTSQVSVIPNGIVPSDLLTPPNSDVLQRINVHSKGYVLFVGRLNPIKGPDLLLEAFLSVAMAYSELHLVYAGPDGGMLGVLQSAVGNSPHAHRVHFAGFVTGADKATLYRNALFLAIPSRHEAMSIVVLEAGVVSVPVLLTDHCGFNEVERAGGGWVVSADVAGLRHGLDTVMRSQNTLTAQGEQLHQLVMREYTWDIAVARHERLFEQMLAASRADIAKMQP